MYSQKMHLFVPQAWDKQADRQTDRRTNHCLYIETAAVNAADGRLHCVGGDRNYR